MNLNPFRRRQPVVNTTGHHLAEHTSHRHFVHPTDHTLPQSSPVRADELIWVQTQIELHASAGTLDAGNPHILDAEILERAKQWNEAAEHEAHARRRTAHSLHAEETQHLVRLREELANLRTARAQAHAENTHWRNQLLGATAARVIAAVDTKTLLSANGADVHLADPAEAALEPANNRTEGDHHHA